MRTATITTTLLLAALILTGCAKTTTTTPVVPTPQQVSISYALKSVADADKALVSEAIAARDAGTCSAADAATIETAAKAVANAGLALDAELRSTDTWCTSNIMAAGCQQGKMILILQGIGLGQLNAHLSPSGRVLVVALLTAANSLSAALGGPVL